MCCQATCKHWLCFAGSVLLRLCVLCPVRMSFTEQDGFSAGQTLTLTHKEWTGSLLRSENSSFRPARKAFIWYQALPAFLQNTKEFKCLDGLKTPMKIEIAVFQMRNQTWLWVFGAKIPGRNRRIHFDNCVWEISLSHQRSNQGLPWRQCLTIETVHRVIFCWFDLSACCTMYKYKKKGKKYQQLIQPMTDASSGQFAHVCWRPKSNPMREQICTTAA